MQISKEKKFIATSIFLSLGFLGINFINDSSRLPAILGLTLLTLILFIFSLWEGLGINPTLLSLILPPLFTLGVGIYVLCRTENIFTVSSFKTIPLFRAARWIGFILTFLTAFLLFNAVISI